MKNKKILMVSILLLAILTIGAVSASEDAEVLAGNSTLIVDDSIVIDNNDVEEIEGNFTFSDSYISLDNGYNTVATLNLKEATEGRIVLTNDGDDVIGEKDLTVNDFTKVSGNYIYNLQVSHLVVSKFNNGNQLVNFMFYGSQDGTPAIHEVYDVEKSPQTNSIWITNKRYIEIYNGFVTEDYDGPIIVVYSEANTDDFSITDIDEDSYDIKYSYYSTLKDLNQYDHGIYSKNSRSGWYYYGVTASDFINNGNDFNEIDDGDTLSFLVKSTDWEKTASCECNIDLEGDGFYLGDHNDEPVGPTAILEIYGNEYTPISYDNGMVFTIIVSGDEKSGSWKPVDELSNAVLSVTSGDYTTTLFNSKLSNLDFIMRPAIWATLNTCSI
ncbi:hypothetical protein [Methanobrevibacter sp.]|uniref:hypothetical protein n=1 Tax=Methanobrevibacter sp. TaxID=66852 RepID=UPI00388EF192